MDEYTVGGAMNKTSVELNGPVTVIHLCERPGIAAIECYDGEWEMFVKNPNTGTAVIMEIKYCPYCGERLGGRDGRELCQD